MHSNVSTPDKTLGRRAAQLVVALHSNSRRRFTLVDVESITHLKPSSARSLVRKLVHRGVATRLRPGLFMLVPFALGAEREYMGNPYLVARELAAGHRYFISHASAMDLHSMVTQPQLVVYVTSTHAIRPRNILGTDFRFVHARPEQVFGTTELWIEGGEKVVVSDAERTVIDGLRQPRYCGGITEVAKAMWIRREDLRVSRLIDYALKLDVGAVTGRLGYLMELYEMSTDVEIGRLKNHLKSGYAALDPTLPAEGRLMNRWQLCLNVDADELRAVGHA